MSAKSRLLVSVLLLTAVAVHALPVWVLAAATAEQQWQPSAMHISQGRKLLQPFTLGFPPVTRARDNAGTMNERGISKAGCISSSTAAAGNAVDNTRGGGSLAFPCPR
jgi:hypothetical protein